jgi:hypothetical protein
MKTPELWVGAPRAALSFEAASPGRAWRSPGTVHSSSLESHEHVTVMTNEQGDEMLNGGYTEVETSSSCNERTAEHTRGHSLARCASLSFCTVQNCERAETAEAVKMGVPISN